MKPTLTLQFDSFDALAAFVASKMQTSTHAIVNNSPETLHVTATAAPVATAQPQLTGDDENGPANANAPTVDGRGFPHDDRIHASSKAMNADGSWRRKRGVTDEIVNAVENEFRNRQSQQPAAFAQQTSVVQQLPQSPAIGNFQPAVGFQPTPGMVPAVTQPAEQPQQPMQPLAQHFPQPGLPQYTAPAEQPQQFQQPAPVAAPVVQPQPQAQPATVDFPAFMRIVQGAMTSGPNGPTIDQNYIMQFAARLSQMVGQQINNITDLAGRPDLIPAALQMMQQDGVIA